MGFTTYHCAFSKGGDKTGPVFHTDTMQNITIPDGCRVVSFQVDSDELDFMLWCMRNVKWNNVTQSGEIN